MKGRGRLCPVSAFFPPSPFIMELKGQATADQIAEWKKSHPSVHQVEVTDPETEQVHVTYLREPNRKETSYYLSRQKTDPLGAADALFRACCLGGSEEIKKNDAMLTAAALEAAGLIKIADATIKKL